LFVALFRLIVEPQIYGIVRSIPSTAYYEPLASYNKTEKAQIKAAFHALNVRDS